MLYAVLNTDQVLLTIHAERVEAAWTGGRVRGFNLLEADFVSAKCGPTPAGARRGPVLPGSFTLLVIERDPVTR